MVHGQLNPVSVLALPASRAPARELHPDIRDVHNLCACCRTPGVKTMSMLGRFRRRMATMSLSSLLAAGVVEQLVEPRKLLRLCSLAVQVG